MRLIRFAGAALVAALVVAAVAAAETGSAQKVTCTMHLLNVAVPGATTGENFGTVECGHRLGMGVQHNPSVTVTPTSQNTGMVSGPFKQFFDTGTISGTFKLTFTVSSPTSASYSGTARISRGTGGYEDVMGSAKIACNSQDETHITCMQEMTLTDS
jgi:hypothetical protein